MSQVLQLVHAALKRGEKGKLIDWFKCQQPIELPDIGSTKRFTASEFQAKLSAFNQLHGWSHDQLHPCFPQFLGLKQTIDALLHKSSPFPLMGLVHLSNEISIINPLANEDMTIDCCFSAISVHQKGITVDVAIEARQSGQICLSAKSTYLYRVTSDTKDLKSSSSTQSANAESMQRVEDAGHIDIRDNAGRKYARISGDYNPIHLYNWSAKLLGFKTSIAHGMHTLALTLSRLNGKHEVLTAPCRVSNQFINPASLPCELVLHSSAPTTGRTGGLQFELVNPQASRRKQIVLSGSIDTIRG